MLKRTIYILLISAMVMNIGAGIYYNGIPGFFKGSKEGSIISDEVSDTFQISESRSGDIHTTGYNMTLDYRSDHQDGETETGSYGQNGIKTRSIGRERIVQDLIGSFDLIFNGSGVPVINIMGDMDRTRTVYRDTATGEWEEDIDTSLQASLSQSKKRQTSRISVHLSQPKISWVDSILYCLRGSCGELNSSSSGSFQSSLNIDEMGFFLPDAELIWRVSGNYLENGVSHFWIDIEMSAVKDMSVECSLLFSEDVPYPIKTLLNARLERNTGSNQYLLDLNIEEKLLDHFSGDGISLLEIDPFSYREIEDQGMEASIGLLPAKGEGDSSFWASPLEVFDHAISSSDQLGDYIQDNTMENIGCRRISYTRNESFPSTVRNWNITLGSDPDRSSGSGFHFSVSTSPEIGVVPRNLMEISSEGRMDSLPASSDRRKTITLSSFETQLRSSRYGDDMFIGSEHASSFGMEIIDRGTMVDPDLSTLLKSLIGLEKARTQNIFIGHVQDRSDPLTQYIVVVDGGTGSVLSTAETEGLGTLLINRYSLDLA